MRSATDTQTEIQPTRFSLQVASWIWGAIFVLTLIILLSEPLVAGMVTSFIAFPLACAGIPLVALVGIYYAWRGARNAHRRAAFWGLALNALALVTGVGFALYFRSLGAGG